MTRCIQSTITRKSVSLRSAAAWLFRLVVRGSAIAQIAREIQLDSRQSPLTISSFKRPNAIAPRRNDPISTLTRSVQTWPKRVSVHTDLMELNAAQSFPAAQPWNHKAMSVVMLTSTSEARIVIRTMRATFSAIRRLVSSSGFSDASPAGRTNAGNTTAPRNAAMPPKATHRFAAESQVGGLDPPVSIVRVGEPGAGGALACPTLKANVPAVR